MSYFYHLLEELAKVVLDRDMEKSEIDTEPDWLDRDVVSLAKPNNHSDFLMKLMGISESGWKVLAMLMAEDCDKLSIGCSVFPALIDLLINLLL